MPRILAAIGQDTISIDHGSDVTHLPYDPNADSPHALIHSHVTVIARTLNQPVNLGIREPSGEQHWMALDPDGSALTTHPPQDILDTTTNLIAVSSPVGGTGVTTIANHLAALIGQNKPDETLLIDANPNGSLHVMQSDPVQESATLLTAMNSPQLRNMAACMDTHWFLGAHPDMTTRMVTSTIRQAISQFKNIIIDTPSINHLTPWITHLVIPITPEPLALRTLSAWIEHQHHRGHAKHIDTATLVINHTKPVPRIRKHPHTTSAIARFRSHVHAIYTLRFNPDISEHWRTLHPSREWESLANAIPCHRS